MTVHPSEASLRARRPRRKTALALRMILAALAGVAAALLVACGSSGKALIPIAHAGPLLSDFEAVRDAAENAGGDCTTTEAALRKTEEDFGALPSTVDAGLRANLRQGISNLRVRAHELCIQPAAQSTGTTATTEKTTTTTTTPPTTTTTETQPTTPENQETPVTPGPGGGTPAPGEEAEEGAEHGKGHGNGNGHGGVGEDGGAGAGGAGAPEGGK